MVKGPWDDLPKPAPPPRQPLIKRPSGAREPFVKNWRLLAIVLLMIFVMPAVVRWLYYTLVGMFAGPG
jgi:hypothetical protein